MAIFAVSDLHVQDDHDPLYYSLLKLVRSVPAHSTLILAGDLFDLFVGSKEVFTNRYKLLVEELRDAGDRGIKTHYIEGNHDFMVRSAFKGIRGMQVHADEVVIQESGKKFFISHGDCVDRGDYKYLLLRAFLRSPVMKTVIQAAPGRWVDRIGNASSAKSREMGVRTADELSQTQIEELRKTYRNYAADRLLQGYDYVIMGHCHDLDEMCFSIGDRRGQYINVGFPRVHGSYLFWSPGDDKVRREPLPKP